MHALRIRVRRAFLEKGYSGARSRGVPEGDMQRLQDKHEWVSLFADNSVYVGLAQPRCTLENIESKVIL